MDMKRAELFLTFILLMGAVFAASSPGSAQAKTVLVIIGTGGTTGVCYLTGGAICKMIHDKRDTYGIRCIVEATAGSVSNINAVLAGDLEFGIAQSDRQYQAVQGLAEWKDKGPQKNLRAVFSLHPEAVTLVAAEDAGIKTIADLKGKRVNIGNPGSGELQNSIDVLESFGINWEKDIRAEQAKGTEAPGLLQDGRIDAFFFTVGHPSGAIKEATVGRRKVRFVPIDGPPVETLLKKYPYYAKAVIPIALYEGASNKENVPTVGVRATLVTSAKTPDHVVYAIVKEIFDNLDAFKTLHPAYEVLTKASMLEGLSAPFHPGAEKYFKEKGLLK